MSATGVLTLAAGEWAAGFAGLAQADDVPAGARRIPDERFRDLPDYPFAPHYARVDGARMHYVDEGRGAPVLLLHGEPTWSYLYRKFIPPIVRAGYRTIAPDHVGFGKSDKYIERASYTYDAHFRNLETLVFKRLQLNNITLVCQDWGGLLGLPLVSKYPERFARLVCMNTSFPGLVVPDDLKPNANRPPRGTWGANSQRIISQLPSIGEFLRNSPGNGRRLSDDEVRAYSAPFPDQASRVSALAFPRLIPPPPTVIDPTEVAAVLAKWDKPVLLMWGDADGVFPIEVTGAALHRVFTTSNAPIRIDGGTHFVQESAPERLTAEILTFLRTRDAQK